jgi:N-acetylmuramoyl-L-alanine amidase
MAININILNSQLDAIVKNSNLGKILETKNQVVGVASCQLETSLNKVGETVSGILPLSGGDNPLENLKATDSIVEITGQVPGLANELIGDLSSATSNINSAIGETIENGELELVISSGAPEAVSRALTKVTGKTADELTNVLSSVATTAGAEQVTKISATISSGIGTSTGIKAATDAFNASFSNLLGGAVGGILTNLIRVTDKTFDIVVDELILGTELDKDTIAALIEVEKYDEAIGLISNVSTLPYDTIEERVNSLNLTPQNNVTVDQDTSVGTNTSVPYEIGSNNNTWAGANTANTSSQFSYVDSPEELVAEFRNTNREITEFIAHWTGTYTNQDVGADDVHQWHLDRGWSGCGYHYVIRRDGRLQRGRPLERQGAHSGAYGHNKRSIGISMAGGYNCPSGTSNANRYISADSLTPAQMNSFAMFVRAFYEVWPSGQALGHNDTSDLGKVDPGFDVGEYVKSNFNKTNLITDAKASGPLTTAQINAGIPV